MASLRYRDEHNKVGYLQKPKGSDDYHQVLDFLSASHIRSPELGPSAILATIDETPYTITEDSVRSQLQLVDDGGIDDLPIVEIYSGMDNLGKLFANMKLNFEGQPMQLLAAMLPQDQDGEGAGVAAQAVPPPIPEPIPEPMHEPDQPQHHLSTPPRLPTSDPFTSTNVEDEPLGGSFHASPPRFTQAPPASHTSGGAEDLITLTALSYVVSTFVHKVNSLETELKAHKQLFKDVVGKLVKKVKPMEVKLKPKKRKVVVSDFDQEEGGEQVVDLDALIALANAAVTVDSNIPPGGPSNNPAASSHIPTDVPTDGDFAHAHSTSLSRDPSKGKGPACSYDPTSYVLLMLLFLTDLPSDVDPTTGPVNRFPEHNYSYHSSIPAMNQFPARIGIYNCYSFPSPFQRCQKGAKGVAVEEPTLPQDKTFRNWKKTTNQDGCFGQVLEEKNLLRQRAQERREQQLQEEFDKIQRVVTFTRGLKRDGSPMTKASLKKLKTSDVEVDVAAPSHGVPQVVEVEAPSQDVSREKEATVEDVEVPSNIASKEQQTASQLKKVGTKKKRLGRKGVHTSQSTIPIEEGDPDAEHKLCIKYASDEDSASDCDTPDHFYVVVDYELLPTGLGSINAIYKLDNSRQKAEGVGLILSGDLKILMDSPKVNDGVHVLETVSGLVIHMFVEKKYPLSINLIERMLDHQLEIAWNSRYVVPTGRVVVPTSRYVVPAGKVIIIVSTGRLSLVPTGRILSPGTSLDPPWSDLELHLSGDEFLSKVEGDGEVRVMTRGFGDLVAKLGDKVVMEVLVRCWSDGDVVPTSVPVIWLPFTNRNSDEAQTSEHGTGSLPSGCVDLTGNEEPTDEDEDIGMGDSIGVSASLGGEIFSGGKKCRESNIGDNDNTRDGGKIVGGAIGACGGIGTSHEYSTRCWVPLSPAGSQGVFTTFNHLETGKGFLETDIRQKDEKSSKNGQKLARNGKAWKRQSQIKAKVNKSQSPSQPKSTLTKSKPRSHQVKENTTLGTKFAKS
ncbi:hypothetical protein Tco_0595032 [Tanacetum coccineum]